MSRLAPIVYDRRGVDLDEYYERLCWRYGWQRADAILIGDDPEFNADLTKWRNLGSPKLVG